MKLGKMAIALLGLAVACVPHAARSGDVEIGPRGTIIEFRSVRDGEPRPDVAVELTGTDGTRITRQVTVNGRQFYGQWVPLCWGCVGRSTSEATFSFDVEAYKKIWPLKVGNRTEFWRRRSPGTRSWTHTLEVVAREKVTVPAGEFDAFKVIQKVKVDGCCWNGEAEYWWAPSVKYVVKSVLRQSEHGRWRHQVTEAVKVAVP